MTQHIFANLGFVLFYNMLQLIRCINRNEFIRVQPILKRHQNETSIRDKWETNLYPLVIYFSSVVVIELLHLNVFRWDLVGDGNRVLQVKFPHFFFGTFKEVFGDKNSAIWIMFFPPDSWTFCLIINKYFVTILKIFCLFYHFLTLCI